MYAFVYLVLLSPLHVRHTSPCSMGAQRDWTRHTRVLMYRGYAAENIVTAAGYDSSRERQFDEYVYYV